MYEPLIWERAIRQWSLDNDARKITGTVHAVDWAIELRGGARREGYYTVNGFNIKFRRLKIGYKDGGII